MTIATLLIALIATPGGDTAGEPLLLDFHASWCGPCKQMRPAIEQLIQKNYPVKSVDIDDAPDLAARYEVKSVPTFIVIDPGGQPLARSSGAQPASQLARMYLAAKSKLKAAPPAPEPRGGDEFGSPGDTAPANDDESDDRDRPASTPTNPKPWETVVRIKVHGQGSIGFGSGTIIHSTPEESIILTCAHIFHLDGRKQAHPSRFPLRITVDLFDGKLNSQFKNVRYAQETYEGKAIDYDFDRDVGLIRIRPGRRLPSSRVVPAHWKPQARMLLTTVGCSEGRDATTWDTTIVRPSMRGLDGRPNYEAIECVQAPKQGRSGGGLYTTDGYVAGVCDFAEPRGNHGLYATPASIHHILDRNNLSLCYAPVNRGGSSKALLANNRPGPGSSPSPSNRRRSEPAIARAQSPDRDESNVVMIPPPELLGIMSPAGEASAPPAASSTRNTSPWQPTPDPKLAARIDDDRVRDRDRAEPTDLMLDHEFDSDPFGPMPGDDLTSVERDDRGAEPVRQPRTTAPSPGRWRPVRTPLTALAPSP